MQSLPRELIDLIVDCPGIAFTLHQTCRELQAKTTHTYAVAFREYSVTYTRISTCEQVFIFKHGSEFRIRSNDDQIDDPRRKPGGVTVDLGRLQRQYVYKDTILLVTNGDTFFGNMADIEHIEKVLQLLSLNVYRITSVHTYFADVTLQPGTYARAVDGLARVITLDSTTVMPPGTIMDLHPLV